MFHAECACEWRVGFDCYVVLGAEGCDGGLGVEGVDFDLVYCGDEGSGGGEEFLEL